MESLFNPTEIGWKSVSSGEEREGTWSDGVYPVLLRGISTLEVARKWSDCLVRLFQHERESLSASVLVSEGTRSWTCLHWKAQHGCPRSSDGAALSRN